MPCLQSAVAGDDPCVCAQYPYNGLHLPLVVRHMIVPAQAGSVVSCADSCVFLQCPALVGAAPSCLVKVVNVSSMCVHACVRVIDALQKMEQLGTADAFAVAMLNCMINVYVLKQDGTLALAHAICMHPDFPITAMQFGTFDRQKRCLLGLTATGDLHVLTMRRGKAFEAKFDAKVVQDLPQTMRKVKPRGMTAHQLVSTSIGRRTERIFSGGRG